MIGLRRHQLLRLTAAGWAQLLGEHSEESSDPPMHECLAHWANNRHPLVITRQPPASPALAGRVATGLPAPLRFGRRRLALQIARTEIASLHEFPLADEVTGLLHAKLHKAWHALTAALGQAGCAARVHGGYGWQQMTDLDYLHPSSDIDLLLPVGSAASADRVCQLLADANFGDLRLDGELLFPNGAGIAWREWQACRAGRTDQMLAKHLDRISLERPDTVAA